MTDKIMFSCLYYYPIIIENINKVEENELNLGLIKLVEIPIVFTRYISKKAERKGRKEEKRKLKKLKEGIIIDSSNRNYKMRLKKNKVFLVQKKINITLLKKLKKKKPCQFMIKN